MCGCVVSRGHVDRRTASACRRRVSSVASHHRMPRTVCQGRTMVQVAPREKESSATRHIQAWEGHLLSAFRGGRFYLGAPTANWNPRVSLILGKKQIVITPDRVLQFTMAGSLDVRFAAVGLEVGATGGAKVTYSKGPMGPDKGNQPLVATLPGLYTLPLHRSFPWYLMRGTFQ